MKWLDRVRTAWQYLINRTWNIKYIKAGLYGIGLVMIVIVVQLAVNRSFQREEKMVDAFSSANPQVVKSELQMVGSFGNKYLTQEDKEELIDFLSARLGIEGKPEKTVVKGNKTTSITTTVEGLRSSTTMESISMEDENNGIIQTKQYIYVTISIYEDTSSILHYKSVIEQAYKEMGLEEVSTSVTLEGQYSEMLTVTEKNEITDKILATLQGKVITDNRSDNMYTVYAYSPMIKEYISVQNNRVNVNVAFSYDEQTNQTKLYMASPVINQDY